MLYVKSTRGCHFSTNPHQCNLVEFWFFFVWASSLNPKSRKGKTLKWAPTKAISCQLNEMKNIISYFIKEMPKKISGRRFQKENFISIYSADGKKSLRVYKRKLLQLEIHILIEHCHGNVDLMSFSITISIYHRLVVPTFILDLVVVFCTALTRHPDYSDDRIGNNAHTFQWQDISNAIE